MFAQTDIILAEETILRRLYSFPDNMNFVSGDGVKKTHSNTHVPHMRLQADQLLIGNCQKTAILDFVKLTANTPEIAGITIAENMATELVSLEGTGRRQFLMNGKIEFINCMMWTLAALELGFDTYFIVNPSDNLSSAPFMRLLNAGAVPVNATDLQAEITYNYTRNTKL